MTEIRFEEPPIRGNGGKYARGTHAEIAAQLRENPGRWAHVLTYGNGQASGNIAYAIRRGAFASYAPAGVFDARARKVDGEYRVYAKFNGGSSE